MELEEKKVLLAQRFNPFVSAGKKEWWYTGVVDRKKQYLHRLLRSPHHAD